MSSSIYKKKNSNVIVQDKNRVAHFAELTRDQNPSNVSKGDKMPFCLNPLSMVNVGEGVSLTKIESV